MLASGHDKLFCGFPSQILFLQEYVGFITILCDKDYVGYNHCCANSLYSFSLNVIDCIFQKWLQ